LTKYFVNMRGMTSRQHRPTKVELSILRVLWEKGPGSVREIQARLSVTKETGYTTAL